MYLLLQVFYRATDETTRASTKNYTNLKFLLMDPTKAWALMDELTSHDSTYDILLNIPNKTRGLYEVFDKVDKDVRTQY